MFECDSVTTEKHTSKKETAIEHPIIVNSLKVEKFKAIYSKFMRGTVWINQGYVRRGWCPSQANFNHRFNTNYEGIDSQFETDIKIFEDDVMKPMDELWNELNEQERAVCFI